jgi:hypothetical protein
MENTKKLKKVAPKAAIARGTMIKPRSQCSPQGRNAMST